MPFKGITVILRRMKNGKHEILHFDNCEIEINNKFLFVIASTYPGFVQEHQFELDQILEWEVSV